MCFFTLGFFDKRNATGVCIREKRSLHRFKKVLRSESHNDAGGGSGYHFINNDNILASIATHDCHTIETCMGGYGKEIYLSGDESVPKLNQFYRSKRVKVIPVSPNVTSVAAMLSANLSRNPPSGRGATTPLTQHWISALARCSEGMWAVYLVQPSDDRLVL